MTTASSAIVQTPMTVRIRELMEQALTAPHPLEFHFRTERYGSLAAAKSKAVSFRNQFHSIRSRTRNSFQVAVGAHQHNETGEQVKGRFDALFCDTNVLPNGAGYFIRIGTFFEDEFEIYDSVTKERIILADPRTARFDFLCKVLLDKAFNPNIRPPYLPPEQEREFFELNPQLAPEYYKDCGLKLPEWFTAITALAANSADFDPVDTPMDAFGVGEDGQV